MKRVVRALAWLGAAMLIEKLLFALFASLSVPQNSREAWAFLFNLLAYLLSFGLPGYLLHRPELRFSLPQLLSAVPVTMVVHTVGALMATFLVIQLGVPIRDYDLEMTLLELITVCVVTPVCEELFFRGYLQHEIGLWPTVILFSLLHGNPAGLPALVLVAIVLGVLMRRTGSLPICIAIHAYVNLFSFFPRFCLVTGLLMLPVSRWVRRYYDRRSSGSI